uniref:Uncharacterized protein n=1 Tax=Trichogramma kaykai TaxID=54128 RepID=A0ABD2W2V0_9HYME
MENFKSTSRYTAQQRAHQQARARTHGCVRICAYNNNMPSFYDAQLAKWKKELYTVLTIFSTSWNERER